MSIWRLGTLHYSLVVATYELQNPRGLQGNGIESVL